MGYMHIMFFLHGITLISELAKVPGLNMLGSEVLSSILCLLSLKSAIKFNLFFFSWVTKKRRLEAQALVL